MFDQVVVCDWSAAGTPTLGQDSIWIASMLGGAKPRPTSVNLPTRAAAVEYLAELSTGALEAGRRLFLGVDFSLGYPAGYAALLAPFDPPSAPPWRQVHVVTAGLLTDGPRNANNRFEVANAINAATTKALFWGRPRSSRHEHLLALNPTKAVPPGLGPNPLESFRLTERTLGRPIGTNWQLLGVGSVGSQVLTGIWAIEQLRLAVPDLKLWPLETGLGSADAHRAVLAETWPPLFCAPVRGTGIRDQQQVLGTAHVLTTASAQQWRDWLAPPSIAALDPGLRQVVLEEEGWMFGVA